MITATVMALGTHAQSAPSLIAVSRFSVRGLIVLHARVPGVLSGTSSMMTPNSAATPASCDKSQPPLRRKG